MDAAEIIEHRVQRDHVNVIFKLLRERIRQPREAAHVHPHGEVLALDIGRADMRYVWIALNATPSDASANGGAVATLERLWRITEQLNQLGIIYIGPKRAFNSVQVRTVPVSRHLDPIS